MLGKKMLRKNNTGFTLVELMAVVLIIGILVAIAIPMYQSSSDDAKLKACKANIRTIASAVEQYKSANNGTTPANVPALVTAGFLKTNPSCPKAHVTYVPDVSTNETAHFTSGTIENASAHQ